MKKILKALLVLPFLMFGACDDILDTEPDNLISDESALSDLAGAVAVLNGAYDRLQNINYYGRDLVVIPELLADNMRIAIQNTNRLVPESVNQERAHMVNWNICYDLINRVNNIIVRIDNIADATQAQKNQIKGESLFLRALGHFDLVRVYGRNPRFLQANQDGDPVVNTLGVPVRLQPFSQLDASSYPARNTVVEVYQRIVTDLTDAIALLDNSRAPFYASKVAAKALLARVHLYQGNWAQAATLANEAITESGLTLASQANYAQIFSNVTASNPEAIFSITFVQGESLGVNNALSAFYVTAGDAVLREDMIDQFENDDVRGDLLQTVVKGPETVTKTLKFNSYGGQQGIDNIPVIRLSELYLIRAEANFENNSSIGASPLADINAIHTRAGLPALAGPVTIDDILQERRLELAFEGHRFFDLVRRGLDVTKGTPGVDCTSECSIPNGNYRIVAAIAQAELDANQNLRQNPQYN